MRTAIIWSVIIIALIIAASAVFLLKPDTNSSHESAVPLTQSLRDCNQAPRNWGFEDDAIQYDVSLRAGEQCKYSDGIVFQFDRYVGTLSYPIAELTIVVGNMKIPFSYDPSSTAIVEVETPVGKRVFRGCGIGKSIQSPEGAVRFMVGTDQAPACPNGLG